MSQLPKIPSAAPPPVVNVSARPDKAGAASGNAPEKADHQTRAAAPAARPAAAGVAVTSSHLAVQARQASPSDVDMKKVQSVRSAIEKKTYKVNAEAIADKMLANAEEILRRNIS